MFICIRGGRKKAPGPYRRLAARRDIAAELRHTLTELYAVAAELSRLVGRSATLRERINELCAEAALPFELTTSTVRGTNLEMMADVAERWMRLIEGRVVVLRVVE